MLENAALTNNSEVYGDGIGATILKLKPGAALTRSPLTNSDHIGGNTNITIRGMSIDGNHAAQTNDLNGQEVHCIFLQNVTGFSISNVDCYDAVNHCIMVQSVHTGSLSNAIGRGSNWDSGIEVNGGGVEDGATDVTLTNCQAYGNDESGFEFDAGCADVTATDCTSYDNGMNGFEIENHYVGEVLTAPTKRVTLTRPITHDNGNEGILVLGLNCTVTDAQANSNGLNGIANRNGAGGTAGGDYATITDCDCNNNTYAGVLVGGLNVNSVASGTTGSDNGSGLVVYE